MSTEKHKASGSAMIEYVIIAGIFALLFFLVLPQVRVFLEDHHDQAADTLSIPR